MRAIRLFKHAWRHRHQPGDRKKPQQLAAFLPAVLEIQETPPNPLMRWLARSLLALLLIAILWACFGQVNIVASAEGKIIPSARVKQIQPLEKGVVKAILVHEGDFVSHGQALVELDSTLTSADKNRLQSQLHTIALNLAVNQALLLQLETRANTGPAAERDQLSLKLPAGTGTTQAQLYHQRLWQQWRQYWSQYQSLQGRLRETQAQQAIARAIIGKLEQTLPIINKRADTLAILHQKNFAAEIDYLQAEQERIQNRQDLAAEKQRYRQLKAAESQVHQQMHTHTAQTSAALLTEIAGQQQQILDLQEQLIKAKALDDKQILYAPVAGRVQELAINTVGGVVTAAQQLMLIVPDEQQLEAQVFLPNKDIGFVFENMPAEIKVHTFPFTKYGVIDAQIANVSDDAIVDPQRGLIYSMHLRMATNTIVVNGKNIRLMPGMAVTAEVKTGKRRIIEFFLAPLLKAGSESIRER